MAGLDVTVDEPLSADVIYDFDLQLSLWYSPINLVDKLMKDLEKIFLFDGNIEINEEQK